MWRVFRVCGDSPILAALWVTAKELAQEQGDKAYGESPVLGTFQPNAASRQ
jgi:hypothetical protein